MPRKSKRRSDAFDDDSSLSNSKSVLIDPKYSADANVLLQASHESGPSSVRRDLPDMVLLVMLYVLQGIPLGLAMGSIPFLLKKHLTYGEVAVFSLASYPYSLKLFWSPIVDSVYWKRFGRRKSWIVPTQLVVAAFLYIIGLDIDNLLGSKNVDIYYMTFLFVSMVFLSATQDIAVDGWALELLSPENLSYASTCQTIGLNTGFFLSFTILLVLNSASFCNTWFRSVDTVQDYGVVTVGQFMRFWSAAYLVVTCWLVCFKSEKPVQSEEATIKKVYRDIWRVVRMPNMKSLILVLLTCKLGFITNDSVTALKLMDYGYKEEELGLTLMINFPLQLIFGYYAARWSTGREPLKPWIYAFFARLTMAGVALFLVSWTERYGPSSGGLVLIIGSSILGAFTGTIQFVSMGAFFANIADPAIGGTYMTLLNTISNFGGTYPQYFIFGAVEMVGYYVVGASMLLIGLILGYLVVIPRIKRLQLLPSLSWKLRAEDYVHLSDPE